MSMPSKASHPAVLVQFGNPAFHPADNPTQSSAMGIASACLSLGSVTLPFLILVFGWNFVHPIWWPLLICFGLYGGMAIAFVGASLGSIAMILPAQEKVLACFGGIIGWLVFSIFLTLFF